MIDEKTLAKWEQDATDSAMLGYAEAFRLSRRYLALRNAAKTQEGRVKVQAIFWHMASRKDIDTAADLLLEGGE